MEVKMKREEKWLAYVRWWTSTSIGGRRPRQLPTMMEVKMKREEKWLVTYVCTYILTLLVRQWERDNHASSQPLHTSTDIDNNHQPALSQPPHSTNPTICSPTTSNQHASSQSLQTIEHASSQSLHTTSTIADTLRNNDDDDRGSLYNGGRYYGMYDSRGRYDDGGPYYNPNDRRGQYDDSWGRYDDGVSYHDDVPDDYVQPYDEGGFYDPAPAGSYDYNDSTYVESYSNEWPPASDHNDDSNNHDDDPSDNDNNNEEPNADGGTNNNGDYNNEDHNNDGNNGSHGTHDNS